MNINDDEKERIIYLYKHNGECPILNGVSSPCMKCSFRVNTVLEEHFCFTTKFDCSVRAKVWMLANLTEEELLEHLL